MPVHRERGAERDGGQGSGTDSVLADTGTNVADVRDRERENEDSRGLQHEQSMSKEATARQASSRETARRLPVVNKGGGEGGGAFKCSVVVAIVSVVSVEQGVQTRTDRAAKPGAGDRERDLEPFGQRVHEEWPRQCLVQAVNHAAIAPESLRLYRW